MSLFGEVDNGLFIEGPFLFPWLPGLLTSAAGCRDVLKTDMGTWQLKGTLSPELAATQVWGRQGSVPSQPCHFRPMYPLYLPFSICETGTGCGEPQSLRTKRINQGLALIATFGSQVMATVVAWLLY